MNPILKNIKRLSGKLRDEVEKSRLTGERDEMEWAYGLDIQRVPLCGYIDAPREVVKDLMGVSEEVMDAQIGEVLKAPGQLVFFESSGGHEFPKYSRIANAFASMMHFAYGAGMGVVNYADGILGAEKDGYQEDLKTENLVVHDLRLVDNWQNQLIGHFFSRRCRMGLTTFVTVRQSQGLSGNLQALGESFLDIPKRKIRFIA